MAENTYFFVKEKCKLRIDRIHHRGYSEDENVRTGRYYATVIDPMEAKVVLDDGSLRNLKLTEESVTVRFLLNGKVPEDYLGREAIFDGLDNDIQILKNGKDGVYNSQRSNQKYLNPFDDAKENNMTKADLNKCIDLLKANYNLILTGAPGTGKTFLAKKMALKMIFGDGFTKDENELDDNEKKQFKEQCRFVQFHPSYDYTDFVEGLRPADDDNGNIGFERKDGTFKDFCRKALQNFINSEKTAEILQKESFFEEKLNDFISDALENQTEFEYDSTKKGGKNRFIIEEHQNENYFYAKILNNEISKKQIISKADVIRVLNKADEIKKATDIQKLFETRFKYQYTFIYQILEILRENINSVNKKSIEIKKEEKKDYIFIIDEINRGEISKIFGELFFSIDPGYRGEKGKVETQYQNMIEKSNTFEKGFYVPKNVYIIGTMNDIDRSVESFDFAMRRRFVWQEIKAEENLGMLDKLGSLKDESIKKLLAVNKVIEEIPELGFAYQIGGAYFLKLENYKDEKDPFSCLWEYHLEHLFKEYLRGNSEAEERLKELKDAYNGNNKS